jgi:hypothetical protein
MSENPAWGGFFIMGLLFAAETAIPMINSFFCQPEPKQGP